MSERSVAEIIGWQWPHVNPAALVPYTVDDLVTWLRCSGVDTGPVIGPDDDGWVVRGFYDTTHDDLGPASSRVLVERGPTVLAALEAAVRTVAT